MILSHLWLPPGPTCAAARRPGSLHRACNDFADPALRREPDSASAAMLYSRAGPYVLTAHPTSPELSLPSPLSRAQLFRRLRVPLPLARAACRCRRGLDVLGDHVAACLRSGVLRSRGGLLERAAGSPRLLRSRSHSPAARQSWVSSLGGQTSAG